MAKQLGALAFKGKFKDAVGFKSSAAKVSGSTFVRGYTAEVSNPRSYQQAVQRCKVVPASLFYSAFEPVLNHAFLPSGNKSRNQARFRALAMSANIIPDVHRGANHLPAAPYQISEGSLGLSSLTRGFFNEGPLAEGDVRFGLRYATDNIWPNDLRQLTIAEFSEIVLDNNAGLRDGMELTFLAVVYPLDTTIDRHASYFSIVLNQSDVITTINDVLPNDLDLCAVNHENMGYVCLVGRDTPNNHLASAGLIISERTGSSWRYTNSFMISNEFYDNDCKGVVESYMNAAYTRTSNKILQQADNQTSSVGVVPVSIVNERYFVSQPVEGATYNEGAAALVKMSDGLKRVVVTTDGAIANWNVENRQFITIVQTIGTGEDAVSSNVLLTMTTWRDQATISEQEALAVFGA